ncbi:MAG: hypothetical protein ACOCUF_01240 [Patescibacteria group bacterium]
MNSEGEELDSLSQNFTTSGDLQKKENADKEDDQNNWMTLIILLFVVIVLGGLIYLLIRSKKGKGTFILFLILSGGFLFVCDLGKAQAGSFTVPGKSGSPNYGWKLPVYSCPSPADSWLDDCSIDVRWPSPRETWYSMSSSDCLDIRKIDSRNNYEYSCFGGHFYVNYGQRNAYTRATDSRFVINLNKEKYDPGEEIKMYIDSSASYCSNGDYTSALTLNHDGSWHELFKQTRRYNYYIKSVRAANSPGVHELDFYGFAYYGHAGNHEVRKYTMTYEVEEPCTSHDHKKCYNGDAYWYDSCGNREEKVDDCGYSYCDTGGYSEGTGDVYRYCSGGDAWGKYDYLNKGCSGGSCYSSWNYNSCGHEKLEDCGFNYCDTGGDVYRYCSGNSVYGLYDYANKGCSGGNCYTDWDYNTCGNHFVENCGSDSCDSWGDWDCADGSTRERARTCYNRGCSGGSCYETPYQDTEQIDCEKDGYPGKCLGGSCYYNGSCGSAEDETFCDLPEQGEDNLCAINFGSNGEPDPVYDDAGGDKSQDKFLWTCYGWHPDGDGDAECEAERDCQVVPQGGWQEN